MKRLFEKKEIYMNSTIEIRVVSGSTIDSYQLLEDAFGRFEHVVKKFSRFDPKSELSELNRNQNKDFKVSKELFDLVKKNLDVAELSGGLYDPTTIDLLEAYGFDAKKDFSKLDKPEQLKKELDGIIKRRHSFQEIILNEENTTIRLAEKQRVDMGAIGKGYAIDLAAEVLKNTDGFLINAGGDLYAAGTDENGKKWTAGLSMPDKKDEIFGYILLDSASLACSGSWANKFKQFNHLINTKTGKPASTVDLTFVHNKSATLADAYATMLYLCGTDGLELLEDLQIGGLILDKESVIKNKYFPEIKFK